MITDAYSGEFSSNVISETGWLLKADMQKQKGRKATYPVELSCDMLMKNSR